MAFKISDELKTQVQELATALNGELTDLRDEFEAKPESWHDTDESMNVDTWLEGIEGLRDDLENFPASP